MPPYALAYSRTKLSHTMSRVESDLGNVDIATFRKYFTIPLPFCILDPGEWWPADPSIERRSLPVQAAWDLWYAFLTAPLRSIAALGDAEANHPVMPEPALSVEPVTFLCVFSAQKSKFLSARGVKIIFKIDTDAAVLRMICRIRVGRPSHHMGRRSMISWPADPDASTEECRPHRPRTPEESHARDT